MGWTDGIVFENYFLAERVSRSLLGTAEPQGSPAKLIRFVRLWERAARATGRGRGRGRDSRRASPRSIPRRASRAAPRSAGPGRRENPISSIWNDKYGYILFGAYWYSGAYTMKITHN